MGAPAFSNFSIYLFKTGTTLSPSGTGRAPPGQKSIWTSTTIRADFSLILNLAKAYPPQHILKILTESLNNCYATKALYLIIRLTLARMIPMKRGFTVDRDKTLKAGQIINLVKYNDVMPHELQVHIDYLFPDGVTSQGEHYMLREQTILREQTSALSEGGVSAVIEILFEYVRRSHFPSCPSRFQSVFAFGNIDQAVNFRKEYGTLYSWIWEVESDVAFTADMRLLTLEGSLLILSYNAHRYWSGMSSGNNPIWEYLMVPPREGNSQNMLIYSHNYLICGKKIKF
jgi:hypothetical protein